MIIKKFCLRFIAYFQLYYYKSFLVPMSMLFLFISFAPLTFATPPMFVWRVSTVAPDIVFSHGFTSEGNVENFIQHVSGASCEDHEDGFLSCISIFREADTLARSYLYSLYFSAVDSIPIYIYTVRATDNFYSSEITMDHLAQLDPSPFASMNNVTLARAFSRIEAEYIVPGRIEPSLIYEAERYTINSSGQITTRYILNSNYQSAVTTANSNPYTGDDGLAPQTISTPMVTGHPPVTACLAPEQDDNEHFAPFLLYILNNAFDR